MEIWAHRGLSFKYPENTLKAFEAAMKLDGLFGIEFDVQLTKDNVPVVIHDEKLNRTTGIDGFVKDFNFTELEKRTEIPSLSSVLNLLKPRTDEGLMLNIELKNSKIRYEGMEEKVIKEVFRYKMEDKVIFSSFNPDSVKLIKDTDNALQAACISRDILTALNDCNFKAHANAVHPFIRGVRLPKYILEELEDIKVRVWTRDPLYPRRHFMIHHNISRLESKGIDGIFLNNPEDYL